MAQLRNLINKKELKEKIQKDPLERTTLSFYRYTKIQDPLTLRDEFFENWSQFGVLGRIYLAEEGINAQLSVPTENLEKFKKGLYSKKSFKDIPFKIAVEDDGKSFYKLTIKIRKKIVADGVDDPTLDTSNVGTHLTPEEFNQAMDNPETIVVDMRNQYESEVGHFEGAICPDADTFREELPMILKTLENKKDKKILLYCTGGIRCEKASAYLKHNGFNDVNQLYGGIIEYARHFKAGKITSKFKGKNFVFDERMGERITDDIISKCHQCGNTCDDHTNCKNDACHLLFIQCPECKEKFDSCCTTKCQEFIQLPGEKQRELRKGLKNDIAVYKSRLRPKLHEIIQANQI